MWVHCHWAFGESLESEKSGHLDNQETGDEFKRKISNWSLFSKMLTRWQLWNEFCEAGVFLLSSIAQETFRLVRRLILQRFNAGGQAVFGFLKVKSEVRIYGICQKNTLVIGWLNFLTRKLSTASARRFFFDRFKPRCCRTRKSS